MAWHDGWMVGTTLHKCSENCYLFSDVTHGQDQNNIIFIVNVSSQIWRQMNIEEKRSRCFVTAKKIDTYTRVGGALVRFLPSTTNWYICGSSAWLNHVEWLETPNIVRRSVISVDRILVANQ